MDGVVSGGSVVCKYPEICKKVIYAKLVLQPPHPNVPGGG
jgi:hypothetical protein